MKKKEGFLSRIGVRKPKPSHIEQQPSTENENGFDHTVDEDKEIDDLWIRLEASKDSLNLKSISREMIFLIGNTRSGKSTLRLMLCAKSSKKLDNLSVVGDPSCIVDSNGEIGDATGYSCTSVPTIFQCDGQRSVTWVDAPGWGDNRSPFTDIIGMHLLNLVANQGKFYKFLVVIPYPGFYRDADRKLRLDPLKFAIQIVGHVTDPRAVGVVVTKVDATAKEEKVMDNITVGLKSLIRKDADAAATADNGGRPTLSSLIEFILQNNLIYLVRRPQKKESHQSQPLRLVLTDPKNKKSRPYYETVCEGLVNFCAGLKFVGKLEDFTVTPSDATKMELQQNRLPEMNGEMIEYVKKLVVSVEASVREQVSGGNRMESLEEVLKRLTDGLQQTSEFLKLMPEIGNTQCSQIIQKCAKIFEIKMCPELIGRLQKVEERFRFLQEITQVFYSGILSCRQEIVGLRTEFSSSHREILKEHGKVLRPKLERMINEQVDRHVEHIKQEYGTRHQYLLENGKVYQGLALNKVEAHMVSLHDLVTSSDGQCFDTPGGAMETIYEALVLAVGDGVKEQLHQLNLAHTNFVQLEMLEDSPSGRWSEPVKRVESFLQTISNEEILKEWKVHIRLEMEKEIAAVAKIIKENWLLGGGPNGEGGMQLGTRIKTRMETLSILACSLGAAYPQARDASFSNISDEICKLIEKSNLGGVLAMPRENPIWCMDHVSNIHFEDAEKTCLSLWRAGVSELRAVFQLLHSVYEYLNNMHTFVSGNHEAQRKLRQMKIESSTITELTSFSLNGCPKASASITETIDETNREQTICKAIFRDVSSAEKIWLREDVLLILGERSVHLSDFVNSEYSLAKKKKQLTVFIIAGETFFVDKDWIECAGEIRNVLICASQLTCVGQHRFVLVGAHGRGGLLKGNDLILKSAMGHTWGANGQDGLEGGCGGPGANVCMVLDKIEKAYPPPLEINCVGGKGGFGMNGGDGHCGFGADTNSVSGFNELIRNLKNFDKNFKILCECFYLQEASNINHPEYQLSETEEVITSNCEIAKKVRLRLSHLLSFTFCSYCLLKCEPPNLLKDHCFCAMLFFPEVFNLLWDRPNLFSENGVAVDKYQDLIEPLLRKTLESTCKLETDDSSCPLSAVRNLNDDNFFQNYVFKPLTVWRALSHDGITMQPILEFSKLLHDTCKSLSDDLIKKEALPKVKKGEKNKSLKKYMGAKNKKPSAKERLFRASRSGDDDGPVESGGVGGKGGDGGHGGCPGKVKIFKDGSLDKEHSSIKVHSNHGPSGNPGQGGTGGLHGQQTNKKVDRANEGAAGKPAVIPENCQRDCQNENWETEIAHMLLESIGEMQGPTRQLLISQLETHDWAMQHLFDVQFWVDKYLSLRSEIGDTDCEYFTKSHLQEELAFQEKLEKFQIHGRVDESDEKVIRFLVKNSHDRTAALQLHVESTPCVVNLRENLDNLKAIGDFQESKRFADMMEHQAKLHAELDKEIGDSKEKMENMISKQMEEIQKTFEEQKQKYKEDLKDYVRLLEKKGEYEKAQTILKMFKMMLIPAFKFFGGLGGGESKGGGGGGSAGGMVSSMLLLVVNISKPRIKSAPAVDRNALYGLERLMRETPRMVRRQIEALERVTREQAVLNGTLQTSLEQLRDTDNELLKCTVEPIGNAEEKKFLNCLGRLEKTRSEMFRVIQWQRSSYPDSHELASVLDYLHAELITADTDADLYKKTKDSLLESMSELVGTNWESHAAKDRQKLADQKYIPAVDMLLSVVKGKLGKDNFIPSDKWKMKEMLKELKDHLNKSVAGLPSEHLFKVGFDKIQQALDTRIKFIDGAKSVDEKKKMADYYTRFHFNANELEIYDLTEEDRGKLARIQLLTRAELLIMEYQSIKWAFLQWAFPYADRYMSKPILDAINRVEMCFGDDGSGGGRSSGAGRVSEENIVAAAEECRKTVEHFASMYRKSAESVVPVDEAWCSTKFSVEEPFFEWKHDECGLDIRHLLLGRPTKFVASVRKSAGGKGAIKVNGSVDLRFSYKDKGRADYQNELNGMLKHFVLEMTHSGVSRYRVNSKYYQICGERMTLRGKVRTGQVQDATQLDVDGANDTRGKMKDFVLSPYTEWTFKLSLEHPDEHGNPEDVFAVLADKFSHLINLQLVGWGRHLNESGVAWVKHKPTNVEKYYDKYNESH